MAKPKPNKIPKALLGSVDRSPRFAADPSDTNRLTPVLSIAIFDVDGPWGRDQIEQSGALWSDVFPKLKNYESMTWGDILRDKHRNHAVPVDQLIKSARERLLGIKQNDVDELFRFRLSGEMRVWGIRDGRVFKILWWDPNHEICPSVLKHT